MKILYVHDSTTPWPLDLLYSLRSVHQHIIAQEPLVITVVSTCERPEFVGNLQWLKLDAPLVDANELELYNHYLSVGLTTIDPGDDGVLVLDQRMFFMAPVCLSHLYNNEACYPTDNTPTTRRSLLMYGRNGKASGLSPFYIKRSEVEDMLSVVGYNCDLRTLKLCGKQGVLRHSHVDAFGNYGVSHFITYDDNSGLSNMSSELAKQLHATSIYDKGFDSFPCDY